MNRSTTNDRTSNLPSNILCLKPLHSNDHGRQQSDPFGSNNPFSHLALEIEMGQPSANPFDKGVMPSFDDRAIDEDYRSNVPMSNKKLGKKQKQKLKQQPQKQLPQKQQLVWVPQKQQQPQPPQKQPQPPQKQQQPPQKQQQPPQLLQKQQQPQSQPPQIYPPPLPQRPKKPAKTAPLIVLDDDPAPVRPGNDIKVAPTSSLTAFPSPPVNASKMLDTHDELDLDDDFVPKPPGIMPSIDLKPQINIRSRTAVIVPKEAKEDVRPSRFNPPPIRLEPPAVAPVRPKPPPMEPVASKPIAQPLPAKPIIDYFGTHSTPEPKCDVNQKEEYFRESQIEANLQLFGVREPNRPLTNVEVSKRKKLILKLVDQKLKAKLSELMNQLTTKQASENTSAAGDNFADQLENLVPDSIPDSGNREQTQNWSSYPSVSGDTAWDTVKPNIANQDPSWQMRPQMFPPQQLQGNPWMDQQQSMNPFPMPGMEPMHGFPQVPPVMRPQWNPNPWETNMRTPESHWQQQQQPNWNVQQQQMNLMQSNMNLLGPPFGGQRPEKPAAEIELELREKEFLERTQMGTMRGTSGGRKSPERLRRRSRSRERRFGRDRPSKRRSRERSPDDRSGGISLRRDVSPPIDSTFNSMLGDHLHDSIFNQFDASPDMISQRSRSRDSRSEDLRVRLSRRHGRSPSDLRTKLQDNRHHRDDDLRNQLADRTPRKRSRSRSRERSRKKRSQSHTKHDDSDAEWQKFKNIVGMLMNIDRDAELTTAEMLERKEIMGLLLENPDLLELDDKYIYKFGKGRLNLAVKEAENILYPDGTPDERIASLISKKIAALPTEKKEKVEKDTVPIQWIKLSNIIDQVLHLTIDERKKLLPNDKRLIERDELLLKISDDPKSILKMGTKYGHRNVEWANKFANKILYLNGVRDKRVDQTIAKERKKAAERIEKMKKAGSSSEGQRSERESKSAEWNQLHAQATKLVQSTLQKFERMSRDDERWRDDLLVQISRDPDAIRTNMKFSDTTDSATLNNAIEKCKEIVASVKSNSDASVLTNFEEQRNKLMDIVNRRSQRNTAYDQILYRLTDIFNKKNEKWTADEKQEREALTEAMIKDPESLRTNTKAMERIDNQNLAADEIIADVQEMLSKLEPSKAKPPKKFHVSSTKVIDIPFVVRIEDASGQLDDTTKTVLLKALRDMVTEIEHPPKPKLLQQRYVDGRVEVVCANLLTFEWLKRAIVSDFADKWSGADLNVERIPVEMALGRDELKSVVMVFKNTRGTLPFDDIVRELRRENSKLYPERWQLQDSRGPNGDYRKKTIGIDIESLAALEQMNRFARMGSYLVYFDISYMGDNAPIPNFEATCQ